MVQELLIRYKHTILPLIFILSFLSFSDSVSAQSVLLPGDVVVVSVNSTDNSFDFIPLVDLEEGSTIWFSNGVWNAEELVINNGQEIEVKITAPVEAGTNIHVNSIEDHRVNVDGKLEFFGNGDRIFAFQKDNGTTRVIYGIGWGSNEIWNPRNELGSEIPASISKESYTLLQLGGRDNYQYYLRNGASGTPKMLASFVSDPAKWKGRDKVSFNTMRTAFRILIPPVVLFDESISTTKESESIFLNVAIYEHDGSRLTVDAVFNPFYSSADTNDTEKFQKYTFNFTGLIGDAVYAVEIPTTDDSGYESTENAFFELQNLSKGELGDFVTHAAFINDNEIPDVDISRVFYSGKSESDYIEIRNNERIDVDLSGWKIESRGELFEFPYGTFLPALQSLKVHHPDAEFGSHIAKRWLRRGSGNVELKTSYQDKVTEQEYRLIESETNRSEIENVSSNQIISANVNQVDGIVQLSANEISKEETPEPGWYVINGSELKPEWNLSEVFSWEESEASFLAVTELSVTDLEAKELLKYFSLEELMEIEATEDSLDIPEIADETLNSTLTFKISGTDIDENGVLGVSEGFNMLKNTSYQPIWVKDIFDAVEETFSANLINPNIYVWEKVGWANSKVLTDYDMIPPGAVFWIKADSVFSEELLEVTLSDSLTIDKGVGILDEEKMFLRLQLATESTSNSVELRFSEEESDIIDIIAPEFEPGLAINEPEALFMGLGKSGVWNRMVGVSTLNEDQKVVIPIRFESEESGIFGFSIKSWEGVPSDWTIKLLDEQTQKEHILGTGWSFDFERLSEQRNNDDEAENDIITKELEEEVFEARFKLVLLPPGVEETESFIPEDISLHQNYPNPFNPKTIISFTLPESMPVKLSVFNVVGQPVAVLTEGTLSEGDHEYEWDATGLPSGMYIYQLEVGTKVMTRKMTLVK